MKVQKPADGIMLTNDWGDAKTFHIECGCTDPDHAIQMWIEVDSDEVLPNTVNVSFYVKTTNAFWKTGYSRVRTAWDILVKGVHQQEQHMLLNKQAALNLADAIKSTVKEMDKT